MPRKTHFNWKLAIVLVIAVVVTAFTALALRRWQRGRRAENALVLGTEAHQKHDWDQAAKHLGTYVAVARQDAPALLKYANAQLNIRPLKNSNVRQAIAAYRAALRADKENLQTVLELTQLYLNLAMPGEAELVATRYLK